MSKSMVGAAGGGKVTVEGLSADVVLAGSTVTVKQGTKVVQQVEGSAPDKGFMVEGGTPRWGTTTYNLGTFPPGDYQIILRSFSFADGNANTTYYIDNVAKGSTGQVSGSGNNRSAFDFTLTKESAVKVVSSGYSGGCTYVLVKLPPKKE